MGKRFYYLVKGYLIDLIATASGTGLAIAAFYYYSEPKSRLIASLVILFATLLTIIFARVRAKNFVFSSLTWHRDKYSWIGHGHFQLDRTEYAFKITDADPGYIHNECLIWSNYRLEFDFKVVNKHLGIIVRAVNLANYVMLQLHENGIKPHIRINGAWKIWDINAANLVGNIPFNVWNHASIRLDQNTIYIRFYDEKKENLFYDHSWSIPPDNIVFVFMRNHEDPGTQIPFPVNLEYGSVGFRNSGLEAAYVKNVLIQRI